MIARHADEPLSVTAAPDAGYEPAMALPHALGRFRSVDQRMRRGCGVSFRHLRTCGRIGSRQQWANGLNRSRGRSLRQWRGHYHSAMGRPALKMSGASSASRPQGRSIPITDEAIGLLRMIASKTQQGYEQV